SITLTQGASAPVSSATTQSSAKEDVKIVPIKGLHVIKVNPANAYVTLGSKNKNSDYAMQVRLVYWGAGLDRVTLTHYLATVTSDSKYTVLTPITAPRLGKPDS